MTWPVHALFSQVELERYVPAIASGSELLTDLAGQVVDDLERYFGRRIVYRAPTEDDDAIYSGSWTDGTPAPAGSPGSPGRTLVVSFPSTATAGVLTVTGTVAGTVGTARSFDVANGLTQHGLDFWTAVSGLNIAGATGSGTLKVGTSLGYVDFHSPDQTPELWIPDRPIYQVAAIYEDSERVYATALSTTDYLIAERERIIRLDAGVAHWETGYRAVKTVLSGGYQGALNVPPRIKRIALRLAALYYTESVKGQIEVASGSSIMGSWSRFGPASLTKEMRRDLASERSRMVQALERGFDLEAA